MRTLLERMLGQAVARGDLDCPSRHGKPLPPEMLAPPGSEWWMAHRVLKAAGCTLPWIEAREELRIEREVLRAQLRELAAQGERRDGRRRDVRPLRRAVENFNKRVRMLNLKIPHHTFHLMPIDLESELGSLG